MDKDIMKILTSGPGFGANSLTGFFLSLLMWPSMFGSDNFLMEVLLSKEKVDEFSKMRGNELDDAIIQHVETDPVCVGLMERGKDKEAVARLTAELAEIDARIEAIKKEKIEAIKKWAKGEE